ncbi:tonB-dependent siderophore receptor family protein [Lysobacter antibioticus]|uniref:TonB-dependent siderophore receptor n=1 Tax=Lysobacter antibioticus TaxID=84531 RepID=UPI000716F836|nr:TonB-dependent siderophore receptor [Lysobacter antibioticus]ALN65399.1 tonB-dependent siderophore receptor family protein [Lysobacter antibioticus]
MSSYFLLQSRRGSALALLCAAFASPAPAQSPPARQDAPDSTSEARDAIETLDEVTVQAQRQARYLARWSTGVTKADTPLLETPLSVSVVSRQQIDDQKPRSVSEALRYTPGAFVGLVGSADRYDYIALRGFIDNSTDNSVLDGLKLLGDSAGYNSLQIDPYFLERIDVFRGPSSVLYGRASPGGFAALTSKQPQFDYARSIEATFGTRRQSGAAFDFTGPLREDGEVRAAYRLVGLGRSSETQVEHTRRERYALAPSLLLQFGEGTDLLLQAYLQHDPDGGYHSGVPADATLDTTHNGRRISPRLFDGEPGRDAYSRRERLLGYRFEHRFGPNWSFRQHYRHVDSDVALRQVYGYGWASATELNRYYTGGDEALRAQAVDNQVQGRFETGAFAHTVSLGLDYQNRENQGYWLSGVAAPLDAFSPRYGQGRISEARNHWRHDFEQTGLYLHDQIALRQWRFSLSGRGDRVHMANIDRDHATRSSWSGSRFTSRLGAVYLFGNGLSPYLSYSESFNPNLYVGRDHRLLEPTESRQNEIGLKHQPPGSESLLSIAAYDLVQNHVASRVLATNYHEPAGQVRSRGLELEAKSQLGERFSAMASYTYTDMEYERGEAAYRGKTPYQAPRHMASLWADYAFAGGLGVGAGLRHVGSSWADRINTRKVPAYTLMDLSLRYELGRASAALRGLSLRVNANNLLDKRYVASCASLLYCYYGEERNVTATVRYDF